MGTAALPYLTTMDLKSNPMQLSHVQLQMGGGGASLLRPIRTSWKAPVLIYDLHMGCHEPFAQKNDEGMHGAII